MSKQSTKYESKMKYEISKVGDKELYSILELNILPQRIKLGDRKPKRNPTPSLFFSLLSLDTMEHTLSTS